MPDEDETASRRQLDTSLISALANALQRSTGASVVMAGALYTVGIIIVNVNLAAYGVVNLSLARAEYVMAGGLWCCLMIVVLGAYRAVVKAVTEQITRNSYVRMAVALLCIAVFVPTVVLYALVLIPRSGLHSYREACSPVLVVLFNGLMVGLLTNLARETLGNDTLSPAALFRDREYGVGAGRLAIVLFCLIAIGLYATVVFPAMPQEFGGGMKPSVKIVFASNAKDWANGLGLPVSDDGRSIGPVDLLIETEGYVVVSHKGRPENSRLRMWLPVRAAAASAVRIEKKDIVALAYAPSDGVAADHHEGKPR